MRADDGYVLEDLGSANGTALNYARLGARRRRWACGSPRCPSPHGIPALLATARAEDVDALIVLSEDVVFRHREQILVSATAAGLPTVGAH